MNPRIMVDTSIWVDFFRGKLIRETQLLDNLIIENCVLLCPIIIQEILQGIVTDKDYNKVKNLITCFEIISFDPVIAAIGAAEIYRQIRKKGKTIRKSNDCLIAWYCIHFDFPILHKDRDFDIIEQHTSLVVV